MKDDKGEVQEHTTSDREAMIGRLREAGFVLDRYSRLEEPLLTTSEVALILRTTSRTVRNWADEGKIETLRSLGGRRLFPASAVLTALESMVERPSIVERDRRQGGRGATAS